MDLWKSRRLSWLWRWCEQPIVNQTHTRASATLARTHAHTTHAPLSANHVFPTFNYPVRTDPLYLPIPIPSSCRFYFLTPRSKPDLICEKLPLSALRHSWTKCNLPLSVLKFLLDYLRYNQPWLKHFRSSN